ncbi:uncharacterized protein LOC111831563 [Capsella rubella]|uniref:uncharacterized protein LOC111831563 n=1 Tax=Capsella rubella TaxID=81985 RepID=UPI000CD580BE|nr:uncharacterized protein LOC111831563 [Capsella rubella]
MLINHLTYADHVPSGNSSLVTPKLPAKRPLKRMRQNSPPPIIDHDSPFIIRNISKIRTTKPRQQQSHLYETPPAKYDTNGTQITGNTSCLTQLKHASYSQKRSDLPSLNLDSHFRDETIDKDDEDGRVEANKNSTNSSSDEMEYHLSEIDNDDCEFNQTYDDSTNDECGGTDSDIENTNVANRRIGENEVHIETEVGESDNQHQTVNPVRKRRNTQPKQPAKKRIRNRRKAKQQTKAVYLDHGDPTYSCKFCGALMWYDERINKRRNLKNPCFSLCCGQGTVKIPLLKESPELIKKLLSGNDALSRNYRQNQRIYNMVFAMTSLGGKVDRSVPKGTGPNMFRLQGGNYHLIGSLQPDEGDYAKYSQLYIVDTETEAENRASVISKTKDSNQGSGKQKLKKEVIEAIIHMLNSVNPYVKNFRLAKERFQSNKDETFHMRIVSDRVGVDGRTYSMPTASEVAALIPGDFKKGMPSRDIILEDKKTGALKRISEIHISYLALQYPLIFCYGEDGWRPGIEKCMAGTTNSEKKKCISMRQWFAFRLQERENECHTLLRSKRLFQQFLCDAYTTIESNRLSFIRYNQSKKRCENLASIKDAALSGNKDLSEQGNLMIPASFTGGPRYMWPEITRYVKKRGLTADDRPDIVARIFKIKLESLMRDLTEKNLLGKTVAAMYTVEFQKRGLPHAHILLFMDSKSKLPTADDIDRIISAEIPDKNENPELYEVISESMIHGPCGAANPNSPCMVNKKCSKQYPKKYQDITKVGSDGYPVYRRRRTEDRYVEKNGIKCDNRYVVPYNALLSTRYRAHINVEWCNQNGSIKYLFKYINKGPDRVAVIVEPFNKSATSTSTSATNTDNSDTGEKKINEIKDWFDCRYVSASEAVWRIFKFPIQYRSTAVQKLSFHDEGKQPAYYDENEDIEEVLERVANQDSMFMAWLTLNRIDAVGKDGKRARDCTYAEIPAYFTWDGKNKQWKKRKRGFSLGRIHYVPRKLEDVYFLRVLINIVKGPTSYDDIKTYNGVVYKSYKEACFARGIISDDQFWIDSIIDASQWCFADYLRNFFAMLILSDSLYRPEHVWEESWKLLSEDIEHRKRDEYNNPDLTLTDQQIRNYALQEIEKIMLINGGSLKNITDFPQPSREDLDNSNRLIADEMRYNDGTLKEKHDQWVEMLTSEQRAIYDEITGAVLEDKGGVFFVYGFGGTGKTFIWKTLSAAIRYRGKIVLNVASSGIASLLLEGGRTAHSRFAIPLIVDDYSLCKIKPNSDLANLIKEASLIIWDEAPMMSKYCFESLDRSSADIMCNVSSSVFAGKVVVFGGDFRQVLPVIHGAGRAEIVLSALNASYLWDHCKVLKLTKNMRLLQNGLSQTEANDIQDFSNWLLDVGDGKISEPNDGEALIDIPEEFLIT